jgi:arginase
MRINLIQVPYQYGFLEARTGVGRGPGRYLEGGVVAELRRRGFEVTVDTVERGGETKEIPTAVVEANVALADRVASTLGAGAFPLILSGGCSACLGVLAGLNSRVGVIWFDAHGDFNTPETTPSGFFDGMPLATGLCQQELWSRISRVPPAAPSETLLVGVRELDPGERDNLNNCDVQVVSGAEIRASGVAAALGPRLAALKSRVDEVYLHFDIDALDPAVAPGVDFRSSDGLSLADAEEAIRMIAAQLRLKAAALTAYNPDREENDRTLQAGLRLLTVIAAAVGGGKPSAEANPEGEG